jgi:hypothetical protein
LPTLLAQPPRSNHNIGNGPLVLATCQLLGLDNAMVAEIASWGASPVSVADIQGYFAQFGIDACSYTAGTP